MEKPPFLEKIHRIQQTPSILTQPPPVCNGRAGGLRRRVTGRVAEELLAGAGDTGAARICIAGGVGANEALRRKVQQGAQALGAQVFLPQLSLCGDNAAMVAAQGYEEDLAGYTEQSNLTGLRTMGIDGEREDGPR